MKTIEERLDILEQKIRTESFRQNTGLGNEVGYFVFDYEPEQELAVRIRIRELQKMNTGLQFGYELIVYDLYELMIELLKQEDAYEELLEIEDEEGTDYVFYSIAEILKFDEEDSLIVNHIRNNTSGDCVVFLTGIGKIFPILRSHKILNNLHQVMDHCPVIMFFPGKYTGETLTIFNEVKDDNYYRAFPLVER